MFRRIASRAAAAALRPTVSTSRTNAFAPALRQSVRAFQLREKSSLVSLLKVGRRSEIVLWLLLTIAVVYFIIA